jgi:hypothetical protein
MSLEGAAIAKEAAAMAEMMSLANCILNDELLSGMIFVRRLFLFVKLGQCDG